MPPRRTRIVFLITQFETGGVQAQLHLRLQHLDPEKFDCRLVVLSSGTSHFLDDLIRRGIAVDILRIDHEPTLWRRVRRLQEHLQSIGPVDIVSTCLTADHVYGALAATLARVPLIVSELQSVRDNALRFPRALRWLELAVLNLISDRIMCCSQAVYDSYRPWIVGMARRATIIRTSIDGSRAYPDRAAARRQLRLPDGPVVGAIGRFVEAKDLPTLLRAIYTLHRPGNRPHLAIAGDGPDREQLQALVRELGLASHVHFLGNLSDTAPFYAAIDVFAMSSRWEGLPVVLLEAMAAGLPAACTDAGGIREVLVDGNTGFLSPVGDPDALAANLQQLLADPQLVARMSAAARVAVEAYTIQRVLPKWENLYRRAPAQAEPRTPRSIDAASAALEGQPRACAEEWPREVRRVLIFRLCPMDRFLNLVADLRTRYPAATIDVVCQSGAADALTREGVTPVIYGEGPFSGRALGWSRMASLRAAGYDLVVVPFNNPARDGYAAAELSALAIGGTAAYGVVAGDPGRPGPVRLSLGETLATRVDAIHNVWTLASCAALSVRR